jgi:hypothetical protein
LFNKNYNRVRCKGGAFMAKMGRPKVDDPKLKIVGVRLSGEDYARLKEYTHKHDMTMTEVMQKGMTMLISKP